ncbi:response regulator [Desulfovermiculus halophilus]|jgi:DNA-binding response OmpR family regulator|uniref:response regulator n=1 Tax=Desulfovermiculus halophilus TaxID=339722 RepID=UPI000487B268|nr:response regulator [Desulfovermiculus halophilus]
MTGIKVLLVDDEQEFTGALAERLELRDYSVQTVDNGEDGLLAVENNPPHIVVLDLKMPGLSGLEVLKRIKSQHPDLPVLLLTGYGSTEEGIKGMQLGAMDYMMKPLNIDELIGKLQEAAGKRT